MGDSKSTLLVEKVKELSPCHTLQNPGLGVGFTEDEKHKWWGSKDYKYKIGTIRSVDLDKTITIYTETFDMSKRQRKISKISETDLKDLKEVKKPYVLKDTNIQEITKSTGINLSDFDEETIVRFHHRAGAKTKNPGIRMNKDTKVIYCEKFKKVVSSGQLILKEKRTIQEGRMFSRNPNGSYSAQSGNDDIIMTSVTASAFFETLDYYEIIEEYFDHMEDAKQKKIDGILDSSDDDSENIYDFAF